MTSLISQANLAYPIPNFHILQTFSDNDLTDDFEFAGTHSLSKIVDGHTSPLPLVRHLQVADDEPVDAFGVLDLVFL